MSGALNRLFVDTSYTRTQPGTVGVTRAVRRLLEEFQRSAPPACCAVAIHSSGFREAAPAGFATARVPRTGSTGSSAARVLQRLTGGRARSFALALLPLAVQRAAWRRFSHWAFDDLSGFAPLVAFAPGDVLFMPDASWHYEAWTAGEQARRQGARVVLMIHDLIPLRHPQYCAPLVSSVFQHWLAQMLRCADAVICNSLATAQDLRAYAESSGLTLPPTGHFRLGCDPIPERFREGAVRPSITKFLGADVACFAAVGTFEPRKNYGWLLEVFERLWEKGAGVRLLLAGRPAAEGLPLIRRLKRHPEQGRRLMTVFDANDEELDRIYAQARALLFPSLAEGFGLPLVEARTRGCPVISSDLPVFRELADEGVSLCAQGASEQMVALVMAHAKVDHRTLVAPMPPFTWDASAQQCLRAIAGLLDA